MLTVKLQTDRDGSTESFQAVLRDDGWHVRRGPTTVFDREPFADPDAGRKDVAQLLRKEHDVRY